MRLQCCLEKCREIQRNAENCMRNANKCREMKKNVEKCRQMQKNAEEFREMQIWRSDSLIVNLEVLFATLLEKLFWGFQWCRVVMLWPNKAMNTKICIRKFLGAFNNQNCWNCQHSHHHEVFSHFFSFCISICMLYDRLKTL